MIILDSPTLGTLDLGCDNGFVVIDMTIGHPDERPVTRKRAIGDGIIDDSTFLGGRSVTITLAIDDDYAPSMQLIDRLRAYMSPRIRTNLTYTLNDSPSDVKQLTLRGVNAPLSIRPRNPQIIVTQWFSADPVQRSPFEEFLSINPFAFNEVGREYDLTFDRQYVPQPPVGAAFVVNDGNHPVPWYGRVLAEVEDPIVTVNGVQMLSDVGAGVILNVGETLDIDVRNRTVRLNNDPTQSRYDRVNFTDWDWDDFLLRPGINIVRIQGSNLSPDCRFEINWASGWL
jgi:hypothetical protein